MTSDRVFSRGLLAVLAFRPISSYCLLQGTDKGSDESRRVVISAVTSPSQLLVTGDLSFGLCFGTSGTSGLSPLLNELMKN